MTVISRAMRLRNRFGMLSLCVGAAAIVLAFVALYAYANGGDGLVLRWLDRSGLIRVDKAGLEEMTSWGIFSINDRNAITWLYAGATALAAMAMALAVIAEIKREASLYAAAGLLCGGLAGILMSPIYGLTALAVGFAAVLAVRYTRTR